MGNILIVDDDLAILEGTKELLEATGYCVTTACDGEEALEALQNHSIDLAIVDLFMPKKGGLEFIAHCDNIPVIAVSGELSDRLSPHETQSSLRVEAFLQKPVNPEDLLERIRQISASD